MNMILCVTSDISAPWRECPAPTFAGRRRKLMGISLVIAAGLIVSQPLHAQVEPSEQLKINVKKGGDGDKHRPGDPPTTLVVEILSDVGTPQPAAEVSFQSQDKGPSVFFGGKRAVTQKSDDSGIVTVSGIKGNDIKGRAPISIHAVFENRRGNLMLSHVNEAKPFWTKRNTTIVAVALGVTGIILWQVLKPGPPTATISSPVAVTGVPAAGITIPIR